jgi:hypothetical protein
MLPLGLAPSLHPQRVDWINRGGSPSRHIACEQCRSAKHNRNNRKRHRIRGRNSKQQ